MSSLARTTCVVPWNGVTTATISFLTYSGAPSGARVSFANAFMDTSRRTRARRIGRCT